MKTTPMGIGIVGAGFARTTQIPGFRDCMGAKVVAIASRHRERAAAVAQEFGIQHVAGEARRMVEKARAVNVLALIDRELRFLNSRRTMRGMLQTGAIGTVRHCNYLFRSDYRGIPDRGWDWWSDAAMGGGTLGAIGSHVVDSFRWMLSTEVTSALGLLSTHIKERPDKSSGGL